MRNIYNHQHNPYEDLYIYYIKGYLNESSILPDEDFIGNWEEDGFSFLFFSKPQDSALDELLNSQPHLALLDHYHMNYHEWQPGVCDTFEVGQFSIAPPWKTRYNEKMLQDRYHITLDPGVVFGAGTHSTTHTCLEAIQMIAEKEVPVKAIDIGTGTGLLALATSKIGCKEVLAVDINFLAVQTAKRNICLNRRENRILAVQGNAFDFIECTADLVIANIHYDVMKSIIVHKGFLEKKWFVLSGLLRSQAKDVEDTLNRLPVKIIKRWEQDGIWHTYLGKVSINH